MIWSQDTKRVPRGNLPAPGPFSPQVQGRGGQGQGEPRPLWTARAPLPSRWAWAPALCPLPRANGERGPPPGGPAPLQAHSLCLYRTWLGLGFPHAKLGSPPFLTSGCGPQSEATTKPPPALLAGKSRKGRGRGSGQVRGLRPRWERACGKQAGLPASLLSLDPTRSAAGGRPAAPRRGRGQAPRASCPPGRRSSLQRPRVCSRRLRGAERVKLPGAPPLFADLHLHSN